MDHKVHTHSSLKKLRWGILAFLIVIMANVITCCEHAHAAACFACAPSGLKWLIALLSLADFISVRTVDSSWAYADAVATLGQSGNAGRAALVSGRAFARRRRRAPQQSAGRGGRARHRHAEQCENVQRGGGRCCSDAALPVALVGDGC